VQDAPSARRRAPYAVWMNVLSVWSIGRLAAFLFGARTFPLLL